MSNGAIRAIGVPSRTVDRRFSYDSMLSHDPRHAVLLAAFLSACSGATALGAQRGAAVAGGDVRAHVRTLADMGFPQGVSLEGTNAEHSLAFRLPARAQIDSAHLRLRLRFSRAALPESNVQVFANGTRVAVGLRSQGDSTGAALLDATIPSSLLGGDFLNVSLRSAVATNKDRCLDQRLTLAYVSVEPQSYFIYANPVRAISTIRQAWSTLPDTVTITLPQRRLEPSEFRAAFTVGIAASNEGRTLRYTRLPALGDLAIATREEIASLPQLVAAPAAGRNLSTFHYTGAGEQVGVLIDARRGASASAFLAPRWTPLTGQPALDVRHTERANQSPEDPTFADLGITDLARDIGGDATWKIPLDLRDLSPGRVPSRVELRLVTAPNTNDRQLVLFAFLNGTLIRSTDVTANGTPQVIEMRLPSSLLTTRNELRVVVQRHLPPADACMQLDLPVPAQLLPSSRIVTTGGDRGTPVFTGVVAQLGPDSPMYLPSAALDRPEAFLPVIIPLGHAFWSAARAPEPTFYDRTPPEAPRGAFVVVGNPPATSLDGSVSADTGHLRIHKKDSRDAVLDIADLRSWSIAQVVTWNGHVGLQVVPSVSHPRLPDWPDAYANSTLVLADADTTLFQLNTAGRDASLLFNDGPSLIERIRGDIVLWALFLLLIAGPPIVLGIRAIIRRTPRRRIQRGFDRNAPPPAASAPTGT